MTSSNKNTSADQFAAEHLYPELAAAYVRGNFPDLTANLHSDELLAFGRGQGLKLHRFKRTMGLPRVTAVIGALRGIAPSSLLDIGTGRGVFLWPLLDEFAGLEVTAVEQDERRAAHLQAVRDGGIDRLTVLQCDASCVPLADDAYDVVTVLEVLEHQHDPAGLAREAVRLASRFVVASVPSKDDDNPEHIQLFTGKTLQKLLMDAGAASVNVSYVLNHIVAVARLGCVGN
ncbi:MAG: methyltransferase domain-containing protein [Rhizobiales bacterium]|nr:methyltransferase domain-containing protein [Hyphomicrobiales bacterium]